MRKYFFIVNPNAGGGRGKKVWHQVENELRANQIDYQVFFTEYQGHGRHLSEEISLTFKNEVNMVIAIGGDGTIHEVANGLRKTPDIPVGFIAAGSGNDFSRGYHVSKQTLHALHHILTYQKEEAKRYDVGQFHSDSYEGIFTSSIGIGFDALIADVTNKARYKRWLNKIKLGFGAYVITLLRLLFTFKPFDTKMSIDGKDFDFTNTWLIAINNIPYYGGGMKINPAASPEDGILDICVVNNLSRWKLLLLFLTVFNGGHIRLKEVKILKGKNISVDTSRTVPFHTDGEVNGATPVTIEVSPKSYYFVSE
ncbi:diacylglycerol/lipid kinase family protein [Neobacillus sp. D3-1R]|uniref:diacylglycerol/lipid kinase family protein n=1 Tax=Neobacillus sp. D3-1R TaxID=3445778 RepID=UPI003F9F1591